MGAKVSFKIARKDDGSFNDPGVPYTKESEKDFKPPYSTGQIIFVEDERNIYVDFHWRRTCYTNGESGDPQAVRYIGQTTTDPLHPLDDKGTVLIDGVEITPKLNDMVALAFTKKEFIFRVDKYENGLPKWFEIGDEGAPEWDDDDE